MKFIKIIILTFIVSSCSLLENKNEEFVNFSIPPLSQDYSDHLKALGRDYLRTPNIKVVNLTKRTKRYLKELYLRIVSNNELLLSKDSKPQFYIIKNKIPFYFSLPGSNFFFSTGLIKKYMRSEEIFMALLSSEVIKSQKLIYEKRMIVPIGFMSTERMLSLTRSSLELRNELNKWAYYSMKRAGVDPSAYLMWMQIQNRNSLDFSMQNAGVQSISREEHLFKGFLASKGSGGKVAELKAENSSRNFYLLLNEIK